jgi:hypothetical protein
MHGTICRASEIVGTRNSPISQYVVVPWFREDQQSNGGPIYHSWVSRNPGYVMPATVLICGKQAQGYMHLSFVLYSRLCGNEMLELIRQGKGELLPSGKMFRMIC